MTIIQCKYIIETAKCGSFNEAANRLFISQANLSENVKKLEEEFKIKIFRRPNKGVSLTSDGAEFIRHAEKIVSQAEYMDFCFKNRQRRVSFSVSSQHYDFVAEAFSEFLNKNCKEISSFALKETQTHDVIADVKNSESNIGIIAVKKADSNIMNRFFRKNGISFLQISEASPHFFSESGASPCRLCDIPIVYHIISRGAPAGYTSDKSGKISNKQKSTVKRKNV